MSEQRQNFGGGTGRMGRSKLGHDNSDDNEAWDDKGSMGMKEKEVGVVSDCNTMLWNKWSEMGILSLLSLLNMYIIRRCKPLAKAAS
jgi:hypothetical protein